MRHPAHGGRTHRPAQDRRQRLAHLARGQAEHEAGQDHTIDVRGAPRIGLDDAHRVEAPGARHMELDMAQLGQEPAAVRAVPAVGLAQPGHLLQVSRCRSTRSAHLALDDPGQGLAPGLAIVLAPLMALQLHRLDNSESLGQALDRHSLWHGGTPFSRVVANPWSTPFLIPDTKSDTSPAARYRLSATPLCSILRGRTMRSDPFQWTNEGRTGR